MKIYASDGKEFEGNENGFAMCNAHELDVKKQKEKEEAERKASESKTNEIYQNIQDTINSLNKLISEYEKETDRYLYFSRENRKLVVRKANYNTSMSLLDFLIR